MTEHGGAERRYISHYRIIYGQGIGFHYFQISSIAGCIGSYVWDGRMEWNGMEWNGMEWNGMEWNGPTSKSLRKYSPPWQRLNQASLDTGSNIDVQTAVIIPTKYPYRFAILQNPGTIFIDNAREGFSKEQIEDLKEL